MAGNSDQAVSRTHTLKLKEQTLKNGFALLKNDITTSEPNIKMLDSRYCRFGLKTSNSNFKDFMASIISKSKAETEH